MDNHINNLIYNLTVMLLEIKFLLKLNPLLTEAGAISIIKATIK